MSLPQVRRRQNDMEQEAQQKRARQHEQQEPQRQVWGRNEEILRHISSYHQRGLHPAIPLVSKQTMHIHACYDAQQQRLSNCIRKLQPEEPCIFIQDTVQQRNNCCCIPTDLNYRHFVMLLLELIPRQHRSVQVAWTLHQLRKTARLQTAPTDRDEPLSIRYGQWTETLLRGGQNAQGVAVVQQGGRPYVTAQLSAWFLQLWPCVWQIVDDDGYGYHEEPVQQEIVLYGADTEANNARLHQLLTVYQQRPEFCILDLQLILRHTSFTPAAFEALPEAVSGCSAKSVLTLTSSTDDKSVPLRRRTPEEALAPCFRTSWRSLLLFPSTHGNLSIDISCSAPLHRCLYLEEGMSDECEFFVDTIMLDWASTTHQRRRHKEVNGFYLGRQYEHTTNIASTADRQLLQRLRNIVDPVNWTFRPDKGVKFIVSVDDGPNFDEEGLVYNTHVYVETVDRQGWFTHLALVSSMSTGSFKHTVQLGETHMSSIVPRNWRPKENWNFITVPNLHNVVCTQHVDTGRLVYCSRNLFEDTWAAMDGRLELEEWYELVGLDGWDEPYDD